MYLLPISSAGRGQTWAQHEVGRAGVWAWGVRSERPEVSRDHAQTGALDPAGLWLVSDTSGNGPGSHPRTLCRVTACSWPV